MGFSTLLMGFSTPSTGKAGRASPLRDSLRSPKGGQKHSPASGSLRLHAEQGCAYPFTLKYSFTWCIKASSLVVIFVSPCPAVNGVQHPLGQQKLTEPPRSGSLRSHAGRLTH